MQIAAVGDVAGRIEAIRSRWAPVETSAAPLGGATVATSEFDPFGAVYQAALAQQSSPTGARTAGLSGGIGYGYTVDGATSLGPGGTALGNSGAPGVGTIGQYGNKIGGYGAMPVPAALAVYGNGNIPRDLLTPIGQGGHRLWGPAAQSFVQMREAAAKDGVTLAITDSYRTYDQQVELAQRKGLTSQGGYAAVPGTSNHGWGLAVDANVNDPATYRWLAQHGKEHGWVQILTKEPWHWEYRPAQV